MPEGSAHFPLGTAIAATGEVVEVKSGQAVLHLGLSLAATGATFPTHQKVRFRFEIEPTTVNYDSYGGG